MKNERVAKNVKDEITDIICDHLDLYRPVAESITDEILNLLELRTSYLLLE